MLCRGNVSSCQILRKRIGTVLISTLLALFCSCHSQNAEIEDWYRGCIEINSEIRNSSNNHIKHEANKTISSFLRECFGSCLEKKFLHLAINIYDGCWCLNVSASNVVWVPSNNCSLRCEEDNGLPHISSVASSSTKHPLSTSTKESSSAYPPMHFLLYCGGITNLQSGEAETSSAASDDIESQMDHEAAGSSMRKDAIMDDSNSDDRDVNDANYLHLQGDEMTKHWKPMFGAVYSTEILFLRGLQVSLLTDRIVIGEPFGIQVHVTAVGNVGLQSGISELDSLSEFKIDFCNKTFNDAIQHTIHNSLIPLACTIYSPGHHSLDIRLSNLVSQTMRSINITAVPDLKIIPSADEIDKKIIHPFCLLRPSSPSFEVIEGATIQFEAKLSFRTTAVFDWLVSCKEAGLTKIIHKSTLPGSSCYDGLCSCSKEVVAFDAPGSCEVVVAVNDGGVVDIKNSFDLVCVPLEIRNLTARASRTADQEDDREIIRRTNNIPNVRSDVFAALGEPITFEVSFSTTHLQGTLIEISFGDDVTESYRISDPDPSSKSDANWKNGKVHYLIPSRHYSSENGCTVTVTLNHVYKKEGVFMGNVSGNVSSTDRFITVGPFPIETNVRIFQKLRSVLMTGIKDVLMSADVVAASASVIPKCDWPVTFQWSFLCFPFARINVEPPLNLSDISYNTTDFTDLSTTSNESHAFLTQARVSRLMAPPINISFHGFGYCKVTIKAENEISSTTNVASLSVESPVELDDILCKIMTPKNLSFKIFEKQEFYKFQLESKISCLLIGLEGSNIRTRWHLNQSALNGLYGEYTGESEGSNLVAAFVEDKFYFQHIFVDAGKYKFAVELKNQASLKNWPHKKSLEFVVDSNEAEHEGNATIHQFVSSVKLSVASINYENITHPGVSPTDANQSDRSYRALVTFELTFKSTAEGAFNVTIDFGGAGSETFVAHSLSNFSDTWNSSGSPALPLVMISEENSLPATLTNHIVDGRIGRQESNSADDDDGGNHGTTHLDAGASRTYRATIEKKFYFDSSIKDEIVSAFVSKLTTTASAFTHLTLFKPIGHFELISSFTDQSVTRGSSVFTTSTFKFNEVLSYDWLCSSCSSPCNHGDHTNKSYQTLWSLCQPDRKGRGSITLNVSNGFVWSNRSIDFLVWSPIKGIEVHACPSVRNIYGPDGPFSVAICAKVNGGVNVRVSFDFGDGSSALDLECKPDFESGDAAEDTCTSKSEHIFTKVGVYKVRAMVNDTTRPIVSEFLFKVEEPIRDLKFSCLDPHSSSAKVRLGDPFECEVTYDGGSNVNFNWYIDNKLLQEITGPVINHTFTKSGKYEVNVTALNKVSEGALHLIVKVQQELAEVKVNCTSTMLETKEPFSCSCNYQEDDPNVDSFEWTLFINEQNTTSRADELLGEVRTDGTTFENVALGNGNYELMLRVSNSFGSVKSNKVYVHVLEVIEVKLEVDSYKTMPGHPIKFKASHYEARNVQFEWRFGDGSNPVKSTNNTVEHIFNRIGIYNVSVHLWNNVSRASAVITFFVLDGPCKAPVVSFFSTAPVNYSRFDSVVVGAEIALDCDVSRLTNHTWILRNSVDNSIVKVYTVHDSTLIIPAFSLPYGNYSLLLNVSVIKTFVYSVTPSAFLFQIVESKLRAVIFGGIHRSVHRDGFVVMDATRSFDPDFRGSENLSFQWKCTDSNSNPTDRPCFKEGVAYRMDLPTFKFSASDLLPAVDSNDEYVFSVIVRRPNRIPGVAVQVLTTQDAPSVFVSIQCTTCKLEQVNSNDYLTLEAIVRENSGEGDVDIDDKSHRTDDDDDDDDKYDYEWVIYGIGRYDWDKNDRESRSCVLPNGSYPTSLVHVARPPIYKNLPFKNPTTTDGPTTTTTPPNQVKPVSQNTSNSAEDHGLPDKANIDEHIPDETRDNGETNPLIAELPTVPDENYLADLREMRSERMLNKGEFVGGSTNRKILRIVPDTLIQDKKYIVKLKVTNKRTPAIGWTLMTFKVNGAPSSGLCSQKRSVNFTDKLSIDCYSWVDPDGPFYYEVSYKTALTSRAKILYKGLKHKVDIILPHGIPSGNYSVTIGIKVSDRYGATTQVCYEPYDSRHWNSSSFESFDKNFTDLVSRGMNDIARLHLLQVAAAALRHPSSSVLPSMETLFRKVMPALCCMPERTLGELECTLEVLDLIMDPNIKVQYDLVSQSLQMMITMTRVLEEVAAHHGGHSPNIIQIVDLFLDIMSKLLKIMASAVVEDNRDDIGLLSGNDTRQVICSAGNIEVMPSEDPDRLSWHSPYNPSWMNLTDELIMRKYFISAISSIHRLLIIRSILQSYDIYLLKPRGVFHVGDVLSFYSFIHYGKEAMRIKLAGKLKLTIPVAGLTKPQCVDNRNHSGYLSDKDTSATKQFRYIRKESCLDDCYFVNVLVVEKTKFDNLQKFLGPLTTESHWSTNIISLNLYSCQGERLKVKDSSERYSILVQLPVNPIHNGDVARDQNILTLFVLETGHINIHEIEIPANRNAETLHIGLNFQPPQKGRFFYPAFVLLRINGLPTEDLFDKKVFIKPHELNLSLTFDLSKHVHKLYLAITNQIFKIPRRHHGLYDSLRNYSISAWSPRCAYLSEVAYNRTSPGCHPLESSTRESLSCRCNHMTSFSGQMIFFSSNFNISDQIPEHPTNYTTAIAISSVLVVYVVLLVICLHWDRENLRKPTVVHLCDNSPLHRQKYNIIVETGFRAGASTMAKVSIVLHGKYGMSETRELTMSSNTCPTNASSSALTTPNSTLISNALVSESEQNKRVLFQRNSRDMFYMTLPESLGPIFKVQLWHNNSGSSPSWYLSRVTVHDLCTGEVFYFVFEKWFAVEKGDGKVEREVFVSDKGLGFFKLLKAKGTQYLTDHHIWFSVFLKPLYSRFTHVQRLTCCLSMLLTYMGLCAIYYGSSSPAVSSEDYSHGHDDTLLANLGLSWQQILVGVLASLLAFLPHLCVQFLFRRSKVLQNSKLKKSSNSSSISVPGNHGEEGGDLTSGHDHIYYNRQGPDHAFLSWRSLQEWVFAKQYQNSQDVIGDQVIHLVATQNDVYFNVCDRDGVLDKRNNQLASSDNMLMNPIAPKSTGESREEEQSRVKWMNERNRENRGKEISNSTLHSDMTEETVIIGIPQLAIPSFMIEDDGKFREASYNIDSAMQKKIIYEQRSNRSSVKSEVSEPSRPPTKAPRCFLPRCLIILAWLFVIGICILSITFTIYLMFGLGEVKSHLWLQSVFFGILQCVFINQPVLVLIMSIYTAMRYCNSMLVFDHYKDGLLEPKEQTTISDGSQNNSGSALEHMSANQLQDKCEVDIDVQQGLLARQRSRYLRLVRPPQEQKLIEARHQTMKETNALCFAREMVMVVLQLTLVLFICYGTSSNPDTLHLNSLLNERFIRPGLCTSYLNVTSLKTWDAWYRNVFQPSLNAMLDDNYILIGGLKLRQVRVSDVPCTTAKFQLIPVSRCLPIYGNANQLKEFDGEEGEQDIKENDADDERYGFPHPKHIGPSPRPARRDREDKMGMRLTPDERELGAPLEEILLTSTPRPKSEDNLRSLQSYKFTEYTDVPLLDDEHKVASNALDNEDVWKYQDAQLTMPADYCGWFGNYGGSGFVLDLLDIERPNNGAPMKFLRKNGWVDQHSSALILTFTFYHPPSNLFSSVAVAAELPPIGRVFPTFRISTVSVYKYLSSWDKMVFACELLFFVLTLVRVYSEICRLVQSKTVFTIWNLLEVALCVISVSFIGCYIYRYFVVSGAIEDLMEAFYQTTQVDAFNVANWDQVLRMEMGFVLITLSLSSLKSLQRLKPFDSLFNVIDRSAVDVTVLAFITLIWLGAFISCGMVAFGSYKAQFGSIGRAIGQAMSVLLFRPFTNNDSAGNNALWNPLLPLYHALFLAFAFILLLCYIRTSLLFNFRVFRGEPMLTFTMPETLRFYWEKLKKFLKLEDQSRSDSDMPEDSYGSHLFDQLLPEFTMTEMENQVDEVLFKMNALTGDSNLPEKPVIYYSDSEANVGGVEDGTSSRNSDKSKNKQGYFLSPVGNRTNGATGANVDYHKQILIKLELEVLKQLQMKKKPHLQLQPAVIQNSPLSISTPASSSLLLSSSSPQLSATRKSEEKPVEIKVATKGDRNTINPGSRPPLPRNATTTAMSAVSDLVGLAPSAVPVSSVNSSCHGTRLISLVATTNKVKMPSTVSSGRYGQAAPSLLFYRPSSNDGGLRRSRSVRCRRLETMAEESEEIDNILKNPVSARRGKSADSNLVAIYESKRPGDGQVSGTPGETRKESVVIDVKDLGVNFRGKPPINSGKQMTKGGGLGRGGLPIVATLKINTNAVQDLTTINNRMNSNASHQLKVQAERSLHGERQLPPPFVNLEESSDVSLVSKIRIGKTLNPESRRERCLGPSERRGSKKQHVQQMSSVRNEVDPSCQNSSEANTDRVSKCKRTKSMRIIDDLV